MVRVKAGDLSKAKGSSVAVLRTSPKTILSDYSRLMKLAEYDRYIGRHDKTIMKLNLSWSLYYPSCSTQPWQLDGVAKTLIDDGYDHKKITAVENQTVVTHPWKGAFNNKWLPILDKYNIKYQPLTNVEWVKFKPKTQMLAMDELFKEILVPKIYFGTDIIHFPTVKTHGHTTTTGAMKNAFGGLIPKYRHHAHKRIHEVLVDLLAIQQQVHKNTFAVMDGTVAGDGAGPRTMQPVGANIILASNDQVAIDAVSARIMGYDPLKIPYIKMAHDRGLGMGDIRQIDIEGMRRSELLRTNLHFTTSKSPVILWDQILRKGTSNIKWLHKFLFHSPVFKTFIFCSEFYHDNLWYPTVGRSKIAAFRKTDWGRLFDEYSYGKEPEYKKIKSWDPY